MDFNIYITPPGAQGFAQHYDEHDVFILPVYGNKTWRLYNTPIELPSKKQLHSRYKDNYELSISQFEVELKSGDLLYIPRGLVHDAVTTDTASIHITLGLHPNYWFELLQEMVEIAQDIPEFRRAVPNGLMGKQKIQCFKREFQDLSQALIEKMDIDKLLERKFNKYIFQNSSANKGRFHDSLQIHRLNLETNLSRRENIVFKIDRDDESIYIRFHGRKLGVQYCSDAGI